MRLDNKKIVETSALFISGKNTYEVNIGIGLPSNDRCCIYLDGFETPRCTAGVDNWHAFFAALRWLASMLQNLETQGYKFADNSCEPPRPLTAIELVHGLTFVKMNESKE